MLRQTVSTAELHALLEQEFRRTRRDDCVRECRMPTPIFCEPSGEDAPNWFVGSPKKCPHECHRVIWAVVSAVGDKYNIETPPDAKREEPELAPNPVVA